MAMRETRKQTALPMRDRVNAVLGDVRVTKEELASLHQGLVERLGRSVESQRTADAEFDALLKTSLGDVEPRKEDREIVAKLKHREKRWVMPKLVAPACMDVEPSLQGGSIISVLAPPYQSAMDTSNNRWTYAKKANGEFGVGGTNGSQSMAGFWSFMSPARPGARVQFAPVFQVEYFAQLFTYTPLLAWYGVSRASAYLAIGAYVQAMYPDGRRLPLVDKREVLVDRRVSIRDNLTVSDYRGQAVIADFVSPEPNVRVAMCAWAHCVTTERSSPYAFSAASLVGRVPFTWIVQNV